MLAISSESMRILAVPAVSNPEILGVQALKGAESEILRVYSQYGAVSNNDILPVLAVWMSSIGPWNTVSQYSQCLQYCPPKISQMLSSVYVRHSRSILEALRVYQVQYLQYRTPKYSEFKRTGSEVLRVTRSNGSIEQWHTASTRSMHEQYRALKYCQSVLAVSMYCPPKYIRCPAQCTSYPEHTGSIESIQGTRYTLVPRVLAVWDY